MIEEKLREISGGDFTVSTFSVTDKTVFPPEAFVCVNGTVLRERFFYVVQGTIVFDDGTDRRQEFSSGDIVYLPYNVTYRSYWKECDTGEPGKYLSVNFILHDKDGAILSLADRITLLIHDRKNEFYNLFSEIRRKWTAGSYGYHLETRALFYEILYRLSVDTEQNVMKSGRSNIYKAIVYLENNYITDITSAELAAMINVKECMFRRAFKAEKGMSPVKYRNGLRLEKAREILMSGEYNVLETAMLLNFDDAGYFSKLFKKHFGISPSACIPTADDR